MRLDNLFRTRLGWKPRDFLKGRAWLSGVGFRARGGEVWTSTSSDPHFRFRNLGAAIGSLAVYIEAPRGETLTPRLYFDWGDGFSEEDGVGFDACGAALLQVRFGGVRGLRALRLDPFERMGDVTLRYALDGAGDALAATIAPALRHEMSLAEYAPETESQPFGVKRTPRTAHEHFLRATQLAERELAEFQPTARPTPLLSLVSPLYNTPPAYLDDLYASFRSQRPGLAELVMSDDGSTAPQTAKWLAAHEGEAGLVIVRNGVNRGIAAATNAGIAAARGDWIGFIDHDDALAPHAVARVAEAIEVNPAARFFYTDEVIADAQLRATDFFDKPAFDDVLLSGVNYINHLSLYRRELIDAIGGLREGFDGSQDYDLLLRALARLGRGEARHIPYPAYIWRRDGRTYSVKFAEKATVNARRALSEAYAREGVPARVDPALLTDLHHLRFDVRSPKISIVVPNRDAFALLSKLVDGLLHRTDYPDFELIVVDNGSSDPDTLALYDRLMRVPRFRLEVAPGPFNFSRQINRGCALASGEAILLLNNDIEVTEPNWLSEMTDCLAYPDVGIVGARLLYPSGRLQHAGVVVGLGGLAGHWYSESAADFPGPMGRLAVRATLSAVTGACMLITRSCLAATGPFDEENFAIVYNDVDICLRARAVGFRTVYTPFATLVHHESASRGRDDRGPNFSRFLRAQAALLDIHKTQDFIDPVMSPWRGRDHSDPKRITLDALPAAR